MLADAHGGSPDRPGNLYASAMIRGYANLMGQMSTGGFATASLRTSRPSSALLFSGVAQ